MQRKVVLALFILLGLSDCHPGRRFARARTSRVVRDKVVATIYRDKSKSDYILIQKVMNSSCHCTDVIAEQYIHNRIYYRLYYGCSIYKTRKELYGYCSRGALMWPELFDGSDEPGADYETRLDSVDKFVLHKIDSFIQTEKYERDWFKLCRKNIAGFKRVEFDSLYLQP